MYKQVNLKNKRSRSQKVPVDFVNTKNNFDERFCFDMLQNHSGYATSIWNFADMLQGYNGLLQSCLSDVCGNALLIYVFLRQDALS